MGSRESATSSLNEVNRVRMVMHAGRTAAARVLQLRYRKYVRAIIPEHLRKCASIEAASSCNLALGNEGTPSVQFWLYPGQRSVHHGIRSEISVNYPYIEGETIQYEWWVRLNSRSTGTTRNDKWCIVAQWHDQPDPSRGESWEHHPSRPAPIHLLCHAVGASLRLGLRYGVPNPTDVGDVSARMNEWIRVIARVRWSTSDAGRCSLYIDDCHAPSLTASGPNMQNEFHHFLKLGNYRQPEFDAANCVEIRGIQVRRCHNSQRDDA